MCVCFYPVLLDDGLFLFHVAVCALFEITYMWMGEGLTINQKRKCIFPMFMFFPKPIPFVTTLFSTRGPPPFSFFCLITLDIAFYFPIIFPYSSIFICHTFPHKTFSTSKCRVSFLHSSTLKGIYSLRFLYHSYPHREPEGDFFLFWQNTKMNSLLRYILFSFLIEYCVAK